VSGICVVSIRSSTSLSVAGEGIWIFMGYFLCLFQLYYVKL
jgi:hypothetical protein